MLKTSLLQLNELTLVLQNIYSTSFIKNRMNFIEASGDFNAGRIEERSGQREGPRCPGAVRLSRLRTRHDTRAVRPTSVGPRCRSNGSLT